MRCRFRFAMVVLLVVLSGCDAAEKNALEAAKKAAEQQAAREKIERDRELREQQAAENRLQEALKKDFGQLQGHWDYCGEKKSASAGPVSMHLEIAGNATARFSIVSGSVDSCNACPIRLTSDGERRFISPEGSAKLKLSRLSYRLEGDKLTLDGTAQDPVLKEVDLSGSWRRTDWSKKSEAEIADVLKRLDANLMYDENNPANPIVKVGFNFGTPMQNSHLRIFVGLKYLQELDLTNAANVSDVGLAYLADLKQLKQLTFTSLPISNEAVRDLKKELPNCTIVR